MWEETENLQKMVSGNALILSENNSIHLEERDPQAKLKSVYIQNVSQEGITLKLDYSREQFFKKGYGNQRCDFVILSKVGNERVAVFIDMKSTSLSDADVSEGYPYTAGNKVGGYVSQLRSSFCFFQYLNIVMEEFLKNAGLSRYIKRKHSYFVILHNREPNALNRPVLSTRRKSNTSPEKALILHADNDDKFDLKKLVIQTHNESEP